MYVETIEGKCPDCEEILPGHVREHPAAGVFAWTCPKCGAAELPENVLTHEEGIQKCDRCDMTRRDAAGPVIFGEFEHPDVLKLIGAEDRDSVILCDGCHVAVEHFLGSTEGVEQ